MPAVLVWLLWGGALSLGAWFLSGTARKTAEAADTFGNAALKIAAAGAILYAGLRWSKVLR